MSNTVTVDNFPLNNIKEKTYLNADYSTGSNITVKSTQDISTNLYVLVGSPGQEQTEIRRITGIAGKVLTLDSALDNSHDQYTDVTILNANQIQIWRADDVDGDAPDDGFFVVIATIDIDSELLATSYNDSSGGSGYWYKYTFYNEQTTASTSLADSFPSRGGAGSHYATLADVRREAGFKDNVYIADTVIQEKRDAAEDTVNTSLVGTYDIPFAAPAPAKIKQIVEELAAGWLLLTEYGQFATGTNKDGQAKVDAAMDMLKALKTGTGSLVDGGGVALPSTSRVRGWPDDSTKYLPSEDNGGGRMFRAGDKY